MVSYFGFMCCTCLSHICFLYVHVSYFILDNRTSFEGGVFTSFIYLVLQLICFVIIKKGEIVGPKVTISGLCVLMIRRPPRSTQSRSSAASDVYKRQTKRGRSIGDFMFWFHVLYMFNSYICLLYTSPSPRDS